MVARAVPLGLIAVAGDAAGLLVKDCQVGAMLALNGNDASGEHRIAVQVRWQLSSIECLVDL